MSSLTCVALTDEIQDLVARPGGGDLITNARCTRWLNEAKRKVCERVPGIEKLRFKNTESLDTTVTLAYALADITVGDTSVVDRICHLYDIWYLDGLLSRRLKFVQSDEFDLEWPDPTHSDIPKTQPKWWTRRGDNVEMFPLCLTANCNKDLRFDGDFYDGDFATEDTTGSDISGADNIFIAYGVWKAWDAIGRTPEAIAAQATYEREMDEFRRHHEGQMEWDGNIYSDGIV
jgi:hypothetical protein